MTIGENIRALRKMRAMTQEQLGGLCGLTGGAIGSYEHGLTVPKRRTVEKLAAALDVPVERITLSEAPQCAQSAPELASDVLLHDGVLTLLRCLYGVVEGKVILGPKGERRKYYLVGGADDSFVLYDEDIAAIVRSAKASMQPLVEYMRHARGAGSMS